MNLLFLFASDGTVPSEIPIPFISGASHNEERAFKEEDENNNVQATDTTVETLQNEAEVEENAEDTEPAAEDLVNTAEDTENPAEGTKAEEPEDDFLRCMIIAETGFNISPGAGNDFEIVTSYPYETVLAVTGEVDNGCYPVLAEDGTGGFFETQLQMLDENGALQDIEQIY